MEQKARVVTLKTALEEAVGAENVMSAPGCETILEKDYHDLPAMQKQYGMEGWSDEKRQAEMEKAAELAAQADVAVLALGEAVLQGGEGGSRTSLTPPGRSACAPEKSAGKSGKGGSSPFRRPSAGTG